MLSPIGPDLPSPVADEKYSHPSPVAMEKSDLPSQKRQKLEEATCDDKRVSYFNEDVTEEEIQRWYDEWDKSQGFEIDFSKLTYCSSYQQVDLDEITYCSAPGTCRDFIAKLANMALKDHNAKENANLELGKVLRANSHLSTGSTYYISFEVTDPSDGNQTKPYRAIVRYLNEKSHEVYSCFPKPSS